MLQGGRRPGCGRAFGVRQHHGARVTAAKLETVEGKLVWSIEVAQGENRTMVAVDAMTGRIVPPKDDRP